MSNTMEKVMKISINIDLARKMLSISSFADVDKMTDEEVLAKVLSRVTPYGVECAEVKNLNEITDSFKECGSSEKSICVRFVDSELGDETIELIYDSLVYDFDESMMFTHHILDAVYSNRGDEDGFEDFKNDYNYPDCPRKYYDIACDVLDGGMSGITTDNFVEFLNRAFNWGFAPAFSSDGDLVCNIA